jgi:hypothetical protein
MFRLACPVALLVVTAACGKEGTPPAASTRLAQADSIDQLGSLAREPMVVRHPTGALFVTGYWDTIPPVWKSTDNGGTWSKLDVGTAADGAFGNSDSDLAIGPDGTVYLITLVFSRTTFRGLSVQVAVSHDVGGTWKWTQLDKADLVDRPWIDAAPDGTVHAIWNDGAGVRRAMSADSGRTWKDEGRVHDQGGSSHLAVGPNGEVAVRMIPSSAANLAYHPGVDLVAVSTDRGATWARSPGPGGMTFRPMWDTTVTPRRFDPGVQPHWVEPLAWDSAGTLYSLWAKDRDVWLGRSADRGATWRSWKVASSDSIPYYPYLIARGAGEIGATWLTGQGAALHANVASIRVGADGTTPVIARAPAFRFESFTLPGFGDASVREPAGEYLPIVFLPDSSLGVVTPVQNAAADRMGFTWRRFVPAP